MNFKSGYPLYVNLVANYLTLMDILFVLQAVDVGAVSAGGVAGVADAEAEVGTQSKRQQYDLITVAC